MAKKLKVNIYEDMRQSLADALAYERGQKIYLRVRDSSATQGPQTMRTFGVSEKACTQTRPYPHYLLRQSKGSADLGAGLLFGSCLSCGSSTYFASAARFKSLANSSNAGCRSGMERQINGAMSPVYSSRMENSTSPFKPGVSVNVRCPLKSPSGMPPVQTMLRGGSNSATVTGNARPGLIFGCTVTRSPRAILPSTFSTVLFHRVNLAASVSKAQMRSGVARIKTRTEKAFIRELILSSAVQASQRT
jgi:hypothetical protein